MLGLEAPTTYAGVEQMPMHGTSFAYTFADAEAPTRHVSQYFEMGGHRAMWHDGWKAVTFHPFTGAYENDVWELYHVDEDYSELHDLAEERPDKLGRAGRPVVGRGRRVRRAAARRPHGRAARPAVAARLAPPDRLVPPAARGCGASRPIGVPFVPSRSYGIEADVESAAGDEGVLISHGGVGGGNVLYVRDGRLVFEYDQGDVRRLGDVRPTGARRARPCSGSGSTRPPR